MNLVGVLALQGGFGLHEDACRRLGYPVRSVRDPKDLEGLGALILPGGESTVMGMLMERRGLEEPLGRALESGLPAFGTCAGAILLARDIEGSDQLRLGILDITVARNAYGSQVDSFETPWGPFIRAPRITRVGPGVEVIVEYGGAPVLVRQGNWVAATFHPELSGSDDRHRWFLETVAGLPPGRSQDARASAPRERAKHRT